MAGCKCPGSCACKIKKPRKPKVKKAVVGGRVKQPQVVIQGMPPVSTTAIPAGYPYLTVTSDVKQRVKSMSTQTETQAQAIKEESRGYGNVKTLNDYVMTGLNTGGPSELKVHKNKTINPSRLLLQFPIKPKVEITKTFPTIIKKETKEMGTETEPLLVTVAKGAKQDIFNIMLEQEATGKVLSLTGAGRPKRPFSQSVALATPPAPPAPAAPAPAAPAPAAAPAAPAVEPRRTTDFEKMKSFFQKNPK